ncbi:hypothetical protein Hanom_Chr02g00134561 [Helianthus anomalus]
MILDLAIIVVQQFNPAYLPHVKLLLVKYVLQTLMISEDCTSRTIQIMSPDLQRKYHRA